MSYNLSAHAVWIDKGDHAHHDTSMTQVPSACRKNRVFLQQEGLLSPRLGTAHLGLYWHMPWLCRLTSGAPHLSSGPRPPGWYDYISDRALASCLSPEAVEHKIEWVLASESLLLCFPGLGRKKGNGYVHCRWHLCHR